MRRYGVWAGLPNGMKEDINRCVVEVPYGGRSMLFHQCVRRRGKGPDGLFCTLHTRQIEKGKIVDVPKDGDA
jgi:hypothetical protein